MRRPALRIDAAILVIYALLALLFFWPVTVGGKTMLPADNAFAWAPWRAYAEELGVGVPHNSLLSDLYLENYAWKRFIVESLQRRELPLWNPYILTGAPFLAAGQHSAMYPPSVVFYLLPLASAYGWFAALHLFLAGAWTHLLARTLRISRIGSVLAGLAFMFSGFIVIRQVFPMIVAAAVWLPLVLTAIERLARRAEEGASRPAAYIPEFCLGAAAFGLSFLAGHAEMYYYVALTAGLYALWRLVQVWRARRAWPATLGLAIALLAMVVLGLGIAAGQWVPMLNLVRQNFRVGSASLHDVLGWAYPPRRVISLLIPDFFGNPSHHGYLDLFTWQRRPVTHDAQGQPIDTIYWGIKNYVEGASYVGVLPALLALIGVLSPARSDSGRQVPFWALLALVSLALVFGTPLYALVYALPGLNQVHSPFRWIYPYTLCIALLAGVGTEALLSARGQPLVKRLARLRASAAQRLLPHAALWGGLALLLALAASLLVKERVASLADRAVQSLALASGAFSDGRMFYSYQFRNLALFGLSLVASGALLVLRRRIRDRRLWGTACALVIVGELFVVGRPFFPAVDPALLAYRTPGIEFLMADEGLYRVVSYGADKTFNANAGEWYGIEDVRGYDSIIPRQYAETMALIQPQSELQYNRIAPLYEHYPEVLDAPLLDVLNVRYVLTDPERELTHEDFQLVYDGEMRIYRHLDALPRAFFVPRAEAITDAEARADALRTFDPRQIVILEDAHVRNLATVATIPDPAAPVEELIHTPNEVTITVNAPVGGFLVLGDAYFDGWLAFIRPYDAETPELAETRLDILRANGNFRAVYVPAGHHVVRYKYSPNDIKFGLYVSFLSVTIVLLSLGLWAWLRFYSGRGQEVVERRVTKNTLAPIGLSLVNKVIDMTLAMLTLRIMGPVDSGQYALAIVVIGWFDILTNFGLNTLLTREVAKDQAHANRYLSNTIALRLVLWVVAIPMLLGFFGLRYLTKPLEPATMLAIGLFGLALLPSNISASFSAVFNAYERMEIPASVTTLTTLVRVILSIIVLVLGASYVGLAGVSIAVNIVTMLVLYVLVRRTLFRPHAEVDWRFQRRMFFDSYPLMINLLLATLFFKVAMLLLEWLVPEPRVLGWYGAAYKYVDAVQVIPAYFTMAIFPLMSRYATDDREALLRAYRLAVKLLVIVALPCSFAAWALAKPLVGVLAGSQYLPQAADILKVMIWYMPLGFINSVTQYVLIAMDRQRFLTRAFAFGLAFNVVANLLLINRFGYMAAAYVAVVSELALLIPFCIGIRRYLAHVPWVGWVWKQAASAVPVIVLVAVLPDRLDGAAALVGMALFVLGLVVLDVFTDEEKVAVGRVLPMRSLLARLGARRRPRVTADVEGADR